PSASVRVIFARPEARTYRSSAGSPSTYRYSPAGQDRAVIRSPTSAMSRSPRSPNSAVAASTRRRTGAGQECGSPQAARSGTYRRSLMAPSNHDRPRSVRQRRDELLAHHPATALRPLGTADALGNADAGRLDVDGAQLHAVG